MIKTTAIKHVNKNTFSVVWDTGRRCNYDCTYCESTRHNNYSHHRSLEELIQTFDFIWKYTDLYNSKRKEPINTNINFTGGEPTVNPNFWNLIEHINNTSNNISLSLNTNGAWSERFTKNIIDNFGGVSVSYHAEANKKLKDQVIKNILALKQGGKYLHVNIMLHVDHWDECISIYEMLNENKIICKLRPIGDGAITRTGWFIDDGGSYRRTSHTYTAEQQEWFWKQQGFNKKSNNSLEGNQMGRSCCGGICLSGKIDGEWKTINLIDTSFKDWYCLIDWFFLYIDQETKDVYHHQTCKALLEKKKGPIGNLSNSDLILNEISNKINQEIIPNIICPNNRCGCGMCAPKAKNIDDFIEIRNSIIA